LLALSVLLLVVEGVSAQDQLGDSSLADRSTAGNLLDGPRGDLGMIQEAVGGQDLSAGYNPYPTQSPILSAAPLIVGLPTEYFSPTGLVVVPEVQFGQPANVQSAEMDFRWLQSQRPSADLSGPNRLVALQEMLPAPEAVGNPFGSDLPSDFALPTPPPLVMEPIFDSIVHQTPVAPRRNSLWCRWIDPCPGDGLGQERLPYSLLDIDPAQPFNNARVRTQIARRMHLPDRAEYFWQRTVDRRGPPLAESLIDYQQLNLRVELGSKKVSTAFNVPLRATNPEHNANHAGLGDLSLAVKTVLLDGDKWLFSQQFTTFFPTGSPSMGLGRGSVSLEPGVLFRNRWNDRTWMHGQAKFWFPLGGDPQHGGQVLNLATGFNRVLWESDTASLVPSIEFSVFSVLNGQARIRNVDESIIDIDGDDMFYITPGMHYARDRRGDLGLFEIGTGLSFATSRERFTDSTFIFDLRWSW
jgi:hypothetical protein